MRVVDYRRLPELVVLDDDDGDDYAGDGACVLVFCLDDRLLLRADDGYDDDVAALAADDDYPFAALVFYDVGLGGLGDVVLADCEDEGYGIDAGFDADDLDGLDCGGAVGVGFGCCDLAV